MRKPREMSRRELRQLQRQIQQGVVSGLGAEFQAQLIAEVLRLRVKLRDAAVQAADGDRWNDGSVWECFFAAFPRTSCDDAHPAQEFMFMGFTPSPFGRLHIFKHTLWRGVLYLDEQGRAYRHHCEGVFVREDAEAALARASGEEPIEVGTPPPGEEHEGAQEGAEMERGPFPRTPRDSVFDAFEQMKKTGQDLPF